MNEKDYQMARQLRDAPWHGAITRSAAVLLFHLEQRMILPIEVQIVTNNLYQAASN